MAAGLGFKDFVTGEVLTAADVDGYLMQGVWVFASAAARDAAVTSPQEGNFAYLKDTNVTTYYTGSAWANLDTTGMTNPMTTTGDTIYSSSGSTPARLGIGSTGNVLTVSGGVPVWAAPAGGSSGLNLISTTTWSGAASQSFNSVFTSTYTNYRLIINVNDPTSDGTVRMRLRVSGTDNTGANYMSVMDGMRSDGVRSSFVSSADTSFLMSEIDAGTAGNRYGYSVDLFKPQTNTLKTGQVVNEGMTTAGLVYSVYGGLTFTTAIQADGFTLFTSAGNFSGTCSIYGYGI